MGIQQNTAGIGQSNQALYRNIDTYVRDGFGVISGCAPSDSATDLAVDIASGEVFHDGSRSSPSSATVQLDAADSTDPRKDVIYWDGSNFVKSTGTPAPLTDEQEDLGATRFETVRPSPPDLENTDAVVICEVWVPATATDIAAADINDLRIDAVQRVPKIDVTPTATSTQTLSGGSDPALDTRINGLLDSQTAQWRLEHEVASDPAFNAYYEFSVDVVHAWDDTNGHWDAIVTVTWQTDPGNGNDVDVTFEAIQDT